MYKCASNMHSAPRGVRVGHLSQTSRAKPIQCHEAPWTLAPCDYANPRGAARQPSDHFAAFHYSFTILVLDIGIIINEYIPVSV